MSTFSVGSARTIGVRMFGSLFRRLVTIKAGTNITITEGVSADDNGEATLTIAASGGGGGSGDVVGPSSSVDSEIALFDSTTGKLLKRATTTGILKGTSGVLSAAAQGTDYYAPGGTDVAVADGGTGSSTASGARTNLGLGTIAVENVVASGDLSGNWPSPTVVDLTITSEAHGDLLYRAASAWVRLAASTADHVLTTQGAGAAPSWKAVLSILPTGLGALSTLLDGADQPNNELWIESWGWNGSARVRSWQPTGRTGYKLHQTTIRPDTSSYDSVGVAGPTASGIASVADVNGTRYFQYTNTTEQSIQINGSATVLELDTVAIVDVCFVMYSDLTSHRFMVYLSDQSPGTMLAADAPTSGSYIMIRQSTSVPDTTAQIVCRDGSTTGAAVDTGITLAADTRYRVVWSMKPGGTEVQVWMGVERDALSLIATLDSGDNIPAAGTSMRVAIAGKSLAASTRGIRIASFTSIAQ